MAPGLQVKQYLADHKRIFDASDDRHRAATSAADTSRPAIMGQVLGIVSVANS